MLLHRVMENGSLLRRWWRDPGDYEWLLEFLRPRGLLTALRLTICGGGVLLGISALCLLGMPMIGPAALSRTIASLLAALAFAWAGYWWFTPWPNAVWSSVLFFLADMGVVVATLLHADPLTALTTTPLFALTGAYLVFFHGPRAHSVHLAIAVATVVTTATWLAQSDRVGAVSLAVSKSLVALVLTAGVLPFLQLGFWLVRHSVVESFTDPLTNLANRRGLEHGVTRSLHAAEPSDPLCAFVIDLDDFKTINDVHGHQIGDAVLVRCAQQITRTVPQSAVVARIGGEEFVVIDRLGDRAARAIGELIRAAIADGATPAVTASIGLAHTDRSVADADDLIRRADLAMYDAKRRGGDRLCVHQP
jgi:diguanylate cyclase (GGDEF)-like protein